MYSFQAYEPLCHSVKKRVEMSDYEFEYEPSHYVETICTKIGQGTRDLTLLENRQVIRIFIAKKHSRRNEKKFSSTSKQLFRGKKQFFSFFSSSFYRCAIFLDSIAYNGRRKSRFCAGAKATASGYGNRTVWRFHRIANACCRKLNNSSIAR